MIFPAATKDAQNAPITRGTRLLFQLLDSRSTQNGDMKPVTGLS